MKRTQWHLPIALLAVLALVIAACGGDADDTAAPEEPAEAPAEEPEADEADALDPDLPEVTLRVAYNVPDTTVTGQVVAQIADRVAERTDGKLTLEIFPAEQLGSVADTLDQAAAGDDVISNGEPSIFADFGVADMSILTGPFLLDDAGQWRELTDSELVQGWIDETREASGLRILDLGWYVGERHIMGRQAYPTAADMEGVRIRIPPLLSWERTFEALDTAAVTIDFGEVYSALQQGVADAVEAPLSTLWASDFHEVVDQITLTGHFRQFQGFAMSDDVFNGLPEEYQAILLEEFRWGGDEATRIEIEGQEGVRAEMEAAGVEFHEADTESFRSATESFYGAFPEWSDGLLDSVRAVLDGIS